MPDFMLSDDPVVDLFVGFIVACAAVFTSALINSLFQEEIVIMLTKLKNLVALRRERKRRYAVARRRALLLVCGGTVTMPRKR